MTSSESTGQAEYEDKGEQSTEDDFQVSSLGDCVVESVAIRSSGDYSWGRVVPLQKPIEPEPTSEKPMTIIRRTLQIAVLGAQCGTSIAFLGSPDSGVCKA